MPGTNLDFNGALHHLLLILEQPLPHMQKSFADKSLHFNLKLHIKDFIPWNKILYTVITKGSCEFPTKELGITLCVHKCVISY